MKCDIIIPVWNQLEFTKECISSIFKNTAHAFHLIIIDNASNLATQSYLSRLARGKGRQVTLLRNNANLGFVKAVNRGIRQSDADYLCFLNNDTRVTPGWLTEMVKIADSHKEIGIVNPNSNTLGCKPERSQVPEEIAQGLKVYTGQWSELGLATGFCMLVKRAVIEAIGYFDEAYGMGNFEDADFCKRAQQSGYLCVCAKAAYVYHHERRSFIKFKRFDEDFERNQRIFYDKWGKPKRLIYILTKDSPAFRARINREALNLARRGDIVWIFFKSRDKRDINKHSNIYAYIFPKRFFNLVSIWRILKRKKKFDRIVTDDEDYARMLNKFSKMHRAEVIYEH